MTVHVKVPSRRSRSKIFVVACVIAVVVINTCFCPIVLHLAPLARNLGTPVKSMTIWGQLLVKDRDTGKLIFYAGTHTAAGWARLIKYDYTKNQTRYFDLPGSKGAYGLCEGNDGKIYIGAVQAGKIFSYNPATDRITDHGRAAGEEFVLTMHRGPDGRIYGATYPNAKVVVYDPSCNQVLDLGRMHPTDMYCRDLAVASNGRIFCGIGSHADVVVYYPENGTRTSILPAQYKNNSFAYTMDAEEDIVYAYLLFDQVVILFNATTNAVLAEIKNASISRQISGGPVLISNLTSGEYMRFNRTTHLLGVYSTPGYSFYDGDTGIGISASSTFFSAYNATSSQLLSSVDVSKDGEGMSIFSLGTGPDGYIYGGVYNLLHLFRYDPGADSLADLGPVVPGATGEFYSFLSHGEKLYMASYTHAILSVYDPALPLNPGTNPRKIGPVGDEQYRPPALVSGSDGRIYIGSIPTYGKYGGALTAYDPFSNTFCVHRNIIPNQSIVALTPGTDGRYIYGGSSIHGGVEPPIAVEAHLFAWDTQINTTVLDIVPVAGAGAITAVSTGADGKIYGCAGDVLFVYDPTTGKIVHVQSSFVGSITQLVNWTDGFIYGINGDFLFRFGTLQQGGTVDFELLYSGGTCLTLGIDGRIYFARGTDLFVL